MVAEKFISRLQGVQGRGPTWRAICPAHESKHRTRSLAVKEADDGRVLIHCFAGCEVGAIVGAVGMQLDELFPPRPQDDTKRGGPIRFDAADALYLIEHEVRTAALLVAACAEVAGLVPESVAVRLAQASERITNARSACRPI